jgi:hypothetical protein
VIGCAGRAYIDVEGLALDPIFEDNKGKKHNEWVELIDDLGARDVQCWLIQLVSALLFRIIAVQNS